MADGQSQQIGQVVVDPDLCIGSASCVAAAPDIFELGDDGKAYVREGADLSDVARVLEAAQVCPVNAIIVYDQDGRQLYPE